MNTELFFFNGSFRVCELASKYKLYYHFQDGLWIEVHGPVNRMQAFVEECRKYNDILFDRDLNKVQIDSTSLNLEIKTDSESDYESDSEPDTEFEDEELYNYDV